MSLIVPVKPDNLRSPYGTQVQSDVFHICDRIKEVDPNLYVYVTDQDAAKKFSIVEVCRDGVERLVFRTDALDGRVIEHLQYLLHVPFEQRFAEAERIEREREDARQEAEKQELYDLIGRPMWTDLERTGFIQRPVSYPKRGVKR